MLKCDLSYIRQKNKKKRRKRIQTTINFTLYGAYLAACISISFLLIVIWSEMGKKTHVVKSCTARWFSCRLSGRNNNDRERSTGSSAEIARGSSCISLPLCFPFRVSMRYLRTHKVTLSIIIYDAYCIVTSPRLRLRASYRRVGRRAKRSCLSGHDQLISLCGKADINLKTLKIRFTLARRKVKYHL